MKTPDIIKHAKNGERFAFSAHGGRRDRGGHWAVKVEVLNPELMIPGHYIKVRFEKDTSHENESFHEDGTRLNPFIDAKDIRRTWSEHERMQPIWKAEAEAAEVERAEKAVEQKEKNRQDKEITDGIEALKGTASDAGLEVTESGRFGDRRLSIRIKGLRDNKAVLTYLENL